MDIRAGELHPLKNSLVLDLIFQRCSVKDLKSCRLVSRFWRDTSRLAWRSSAAVKIHPYNPDGYGKRNGMSQFKSFSDTYDRGQGQMQITDAPFTNYHLEIEDSRWFYQFWGLSVKVLSLESVKFESRQAFVKTIFNLCQNLEKLNLVRVTFNADKVIDQVKWNEIQELKKLKSLTLDTNDFAWEDGAWIEFLIRLPTLKEIKLEGPAQSSICEPFFQSVKKIREDYPNKLNLKLIDIRRFWDIPPAILTVLLDSNLHLEYLYLGSAFLHDLGNSMPEVLNNHSSSLKKLILKRSAAVPNDFHFSSQKQLENLQELTICHYKNENYPLIEFLRLSPNLRKIEFRNQSTKYLGAADLYLSGTQDITLNWCSQLEIRVPDLTVQDLEHLISWMPNLKKLRIYELNNETFCKVCEGWSKLEMLEVISSNVNDSGITGLDAEDVHKINENGGAGVWRPTTVPRANITCLNELHTFKLHAPLRGVRRLGYSAVAFGIELLPNLKRLSIRDFNLRGPARAIWKNMFAQFPWPEDDEKWLRGIK